MNVLVSVPVCSGVVSALPIAPGQQALSCSADWQVKTGLLVDAAYSPVLEIMLDHGGVDVSIVYQVMGYALGFFSLGCVFGFIFQLLRRAKAR